MTPSSPTLVEPAVLSVAGLQQLISLLTTDGYQVIGPTVHDGAVVPGPVDSLEDLPRGVGDEQSPGHYRLTRSGRGEFFGYAAPAVSWKPYVFPAQRLLWRADADGIPGPPMEMPPRLALLGVRACDLAALSVQDQVFISREHLDSDYAARRLAVFVIAVGCGHPASTCFCTSMGTGPQADRGYDIQLTEVHDDDGHRFVARAGSDHGAEVLARLDVVAASAEDEAAAEAVIAGARAAMTTTRGVDTLDLRDLLYANAEHPRWDDVAQRCLACSNCTMVCPTCFCVTAVDAADLGEPPARVSVWDSCFAPGHSELGGRPLRSTTRTRYRQWLTHKFGSWIDQFGVSGCVGCGRCIAWCPAGIDVREELDALRQTPAGTTSGSERS
jgi:sulfhydrogenase subunit beta (sulfur reductase)